MNMLTLYWLALALVALFGMSIGFFTGDQKTFAINAVCFLFDIFMLLRQPGV